MRSRSIAYLLALGFVFSASAFVKAQKKKPSKDEKKELKEWKKKLSDMDPVAFKNLYEEYNILKGEVPVLKRKAEALDSEVKSVRNRLNSLDQDIKSESEACNKKKEQSSSFGENQKGTVFKVQVGEIGAFQGPNEHLAGVSKDLDGAVKYTLGYFKVNNDKDVSEYQKVMAEAEKFKEYLRKMGLKQAFVISYYDNVRSNLIEISNTKKQQILADDND